MARDKQFEKMIMICEIEHILYQNEPIKQNINIKEETAA